MLVAYFYLSFILLLKNLYLFMNVNLSIVESEKVLKKVFECGSTSDHRMSMLHSCKTKDVEAQCQIRFLIGATAGRIICLSRHYIIL